MIITLCGSMRFFDLMLTVASELTAEGHIVLAPFAVIAPEDQDGGFKEMLDALHRKKIDMSDGVIIVYDQTRYMGESTKNELAYAVRNHKHVSVREVGNTQAAYATCQRCGQVITDAGAPDGSYISRSV